MAKELNWNYMQHQFVAIKLIKKAWSRYPSSAESVMWEIVLLRTQQVIN